MQHQFFKNYSHFALIHNDFFSRVAYNIYGSNEIINKRYYKLTLHLHQFAMYFTTLKIGFRRQLEERGNINLKKLAFLWRENSYQSIFNQNDNTFWF